MSKFPIPSKRKTDRSLAVTLEVPPGVADEIEGVLRGYAEEAELDTALVVDHSGFLIAGISALPDVDVDTIGNLVAGAAAATENLTEALGEEGRVESLHLGEERLLYLKEVGERYILVGVSDSNVPAGILRDQANLIEESLIKHLGKVKAVPMSLTKKKLDESMKETLPEPSVPKPRSLRQSPPPPPTSAREDEAENDVEEETSKKISGSIPRVPVGPARPPSRVNVRPQVTNNAVPVQKKEDPIPESVFEFDDPDSSDDEDDIFNSGGPGESSPAEKPTSSPIESKQVKPKPPTAIVENSPFEMDDEEEAPARNNPASTPVHLSVPAARKRDAERRQDDDDNQSGPKYSFELG